ncbi:MAG: ATP-dependent DNA helicase RecQ [Ginsengibacter sp.]
MPTPVEILKKFWGYDQFRPLQEEIIESILAGNDALALLPTGGGKSLCFQIPALVNDGICLVISPLIALMKDQVQNLKNRGIPALSIYSGMSFTEVNNTLKNAAYGNFKFLYVSPERLETDLFLEFLTIIKVNLIAVDEAHCISQWGYDFRPPYLRIAAIRSYFPNVPVLALTASATLEVQRDICAKLEFKPGFRSFQQSFERANLSYSLFELTSKQNKLVDILQKVNGTGIVYCKTRKRTKEISELLILNGINADFYHAGLLNDERSRKQEEWINNKIRIICCTNAFGMGIDKPDVRVVVHYDSPDALENYYQEAGRAGRDGKKSYAVLFYNEQEIADLKRQSAIKFPPLEMIRKVYGSLCNFFQLASGVGEGLSFDFDINLFVKNFKLEAFVVNSVLKILEQEERITYSEQFFSPSTVVFTTDRAELEILEKENPQMDVVIKGLLRSYDGIFDYPSAINENQLSKFISIKKENLIAILNQLNGMGMIEYAPQKEKPQVIFLENRVPANELTINEKNILKRKEAYEKRLKAMLNFMQDHLRCRSEMIGAYFNDHQIKPCGICDNCLHLKKVIVSNKEFELISFKIKQAISQEPLLFSELKKQLSSVNQSKVWKVFHFLLDENMVKTNKDGKILLHVKR